MSEWDGKERRGVSWETVVSHMATVNEKLDNIDKKISGVDEKVGIQNGRVRKLEDWRAGIKGQILGISSACSCAAVVIGLLISVLKK